MRPPIPGLRPIGPTMRRIKYDANRPSKTMLHVPPGDELEVSDEVAEQLQAADAHFKDVTPADAEPGPEPEPEPVEADDVADDNVCTTCGYEAKSPGGLASHRRKHDG